MIQKCNICSFLRNFYTVLISIILFIIIIIGIYSNNKSFFLSPYVIKHNPYTIPNIIWLYWDGNISESTSFFLHNLKEKLQSYNIIFLCNSTLLNYVKKEDIPLAICKLNKANQVDYYRFYLLYYYGGIWMDSSTYLKNESFVNSFVDKVKKNQSLLGAFNYLFHPNYHIEVGFIISPRYSPFIEGVLKEMDLSLNMGRKKYMHKRIDEGIIVKSNVAVEHKGKRRRVNPYFYVYVCILTVLQRDYNNEANICLLKAEDYMYKIHTFCDWDKECIKKQWEENEEVKEYPIIKFNHDNKDIITFPKVTFI